MPGREKAFPIRIKVPKGSAAPDPFWHPNPIRQKKIPLTTASGILFYVREKIRTPDTLVRSQVLYPAELRTHILFLLLRRTSLATETILLYNLYFVNYIFSIFVFFSNREYGSQCYLDE